MPTTKHPTKGFASMSPERRREAARKGGLMAQRSGKAYRFTHEAAQIAGRKGGQISRRGSKGKELR